MTRMNKIFEAASSCAGSDLAASRDIQVAVTGNAASLRTPRFIGVTMNVASGTAGRIATIRSPNQTVSSLVSATSPLFYSAAALAAIFRRTYHYRLRGSAKPRPASRRAARQALLPLAGLQSPPGAIHRVAHAALPATVSAMLRESAVFSN